MTTFLPFLLVWMFVGPLIGMTALGLYVLVFKRVRVSRSKRIDLDPQFAYVIGVLLLAFSLATLAWMAYLVFS